MKSSTTPPRFPAILLLSALLVGFSPAFAFPARKVAVAFDPDDHPRVATRECGTVLTPGDVRAFQERIETGEPGIPSQAPGPPYYVPIAPHIVRTSAGTGGLPESRYHQANVDANLHFQGAGIVFYTLGPIDYIDSDLYYYNINSMQRIDGLRNTNRVPGAINIYFTENLAIGSTPICGISSFTTSMVQGIVMKNSCTASDQEPGNHSTYSHEIGHYFDLFHTHETAFGVEYVNQTNCDVAGDLLCDTPADPRLVTSGPDQNVAPDSCQYVGSQKDPLGDDYAPDATLIMSYSFKHCRDLLTVASLDRAVTTLVNDRPGLMTDPVSAPVIADGAEAGGSAVVLSAPRPNPMSGTAALVLDLPRSGMVEITIHDVRGARVRTLEYGFLPAGRHTVGWDGVDFAGRPAAPGIYFVRMSAFGEKITRKIQLVR